MGLVNQGHLHACKYVNIYLGKEKQKRMKKKKINNSFGESLKKVIKLLYLDIFIFANHTKKIGYCFLFDML